MKVLPELGTSQNQTWFNLKEKNEMCYGRALDGF